MKKERKPITWKHYAFCAAAAVALAALVLYINGFFAGEIKTERELFRVLSDAFLIPGSLLVCIGIVTLFYQLGAFDGLAFIAKQFKDAMSREKFKNAHVQTFAEFVKARNAAPKPPCRHFLIVGGICMALCVLYMILNAVAA